MLRNEEGLKQSQGLTVRERDLSPQAPIDSRPRFRSGEKSEGGILEYWQIVKRRKLLLVVCSILGAIGAFVMLIFQEPVYGATTTLEVQGFNESFMGMNTVDPQANTGNYSVNTANINTQIKIIESGSVRMPVIDRLRRETAPVTPPAHGLLAKLRARLQHSQEDPLVQMKKALGLAAMTLHGKAVLGTRIISISCDSTIPEIAANFANTVAYEYMAQNAQQRSISNQKTAQWLETQLEETKVKLEQAESRLQEFTRQSGLTFVGEQETLANSRLRQLTADLGGIQSEVISKQAIYEQVKSSPPDAMPEVVESAAFKTDQLKLAELKQDLAKLLQTLTPANPRVQRVQEQIAETTAEMQKDKQAAMQRIRNDYESAVRREKLLAGAYASQAGTVSGQADKAAQYMLLKREVDIYHQTLNIMLSQANQAAVVSAVPTNNLRVIDPANAPGVPYKPKAGDYELYGVLLGCGVGIGLAFGIEKLSTWRSSLTFGVPGYSPSILNVPELGVIPSATVDVLTDETHSRWKWRIRPANNKPAAAEPKAVELEIAKRRSSFLAESFRLTLTSILLMSRRGLQPKVIVVTSPNPGEGKTTVVSNMAIAIAESGRKVLVIDADLRRPQQHAIFGIDKAEGFGDLIGRTKGNGLDKPGATVCETQIPGVFLVPSGSTDVGNLSQVFHSPEIPVLLKKLSEQFDVILVDTPPMLQFSDARLMARLADGVILVVRSGVTGCESAVIAREQLAQDHIELLGTILNDWDAKASKKNPYHSYYTAYAQYQKSVSE